MGTETIEPRSPSAKGTLSIVDKLCAYQAAWLAREHSQRYGWHSFAVPIITTTARRAANILELIQIGRASCRERV